MKLVVTFKQYCLPVEDSGIQAVKRGESEYPFTEEIEGKSAACIAQEAAKRAKKYSTEANADIQVFEIRSKAVRI